MDTKCSKCTAPIQVHTDTPKADHDCEACETYIEIEACETVISFEGLIAQEIKDGR